MTQLTKKFIAVDAVDGSKLKLLNSQMLRGRNVANTADVNILQVNTADKTEFQTVPVMLSSAPIPSALKDLATVEYVQNIVSSKGDPKNSVALMADVNVPLSGSTPLVIDGVTVTDQMDLILTAQTAGSQNFIYRATITGGSYTLARRSDSDVSANVTSGAYCFVVQGTTYSGYDALISTPDPIVLDTTSLTIIRQASTAAQVAGDMLTRTGNNWTVDLATNSGLKSTNPGNAAGQLAVKTDDASLVKDQSTKINATGAVVAVKQRKSAFTLVSGDITNQFIDLTSVAVQDSILLTVVGSGAQVETDDYTVNYTGGSGGNTRITFAGGLATGGVSALVVGDKVVVYFGAF